MMELAHAGKHRTSGMLISLVSATLAPGCFFGHFDVVEHWLGVIWDAPSRMPHRQVHVDNEVSSTISTPKHLSYRLLIVALRLFFLGGEVSGVQLLFLWHRSNETLQNSSCATPGVYGTLYAYPTYSCKDFPVPDGRWEWKRGEGFFSKGEFCETSPKTKMNGSPEDAPLGKVKKHFEIHKVFWFYINVIFLGCVYQLSDWIPGYRPDGKIMCYLTKSIEWDDHPSTVVLFLKLIHSVLLDA